MLAEDFDYSHIEIKNIVYKADKNQFSSFHLHFSRQMTEEIASWQCNVSHYLTDKG